MKIRPESIVIYCDGGSRGNPGPAASAFVVTKDGEKIGEGSVFFERATNNEAEYNSVLLAVKWIIAEGKRSCVFSNIVFNLDSQLVERQLNGFYKVKNDKLKKYFLEIKDIQKKFNLDIKFIWNYRNNNKLADDLVNLTMDKNLRRENS